MDLLAYWNMTCRRARTAGSTHTMAGGQTGRGQNRPQISRTQHHASREHTHVDSFIRHR